MRLSALAALPQGGKAYPRARAAAWGQAFLGWLARFSRPSLRRDCRRDVAGFFSFCRKPPWEARPAGVTEWLQEGLAGKADITRYNRLSPVRHFYRLACKASWASPSGRRLRLCLVDPGRWVRQPKQMRHSLAMALIEADLQRLWAPFDLDTPLGRRLVLA